MLASLRNSTMKYQWGAGSDLCTDPDLACGVQSYDFIQQAIEVLEGK